MNLYLAAILHVVTSFALTASQFTYIESGAPTACQFQSLSWDGAAWHAQVSACVSDRVFKSGFE